MTLHELKELGRLLVSLQESDLGGLQNFARGEWGRRELEAMADDINRVVITYPESK